MVLSGQRGRVINILGLQPRDKAAMHVGGQYDFRSIQ